jgi:hypothetical protein
LEAGFLPSSLARAEDRHMTRKVIIHLALGLTAALGVPLNSQEPDRPEPRPAVAPVAKGNDYLLHYLPPRPKDFVAHFSTGAGTSGIDHVLLHTTISTGEMRVLLQMRGDRVHVLGHAADRERFYIAVRTQEVGPGFGPGFRPRFVARCMIYAFWLADGSQVAQTELKVEKLAEQPGMDRPVAEGGPIELTEGGVRCLGRTLRFDGRKLLTSVERE